MLSLSASPTLSLKQELTVRLRSDCDPHDLSMLELSNKWGPRLVAQSETGMGYQVACVILKDGSRCNQVLIESGFVIRIQRPRSHPFHGRGHRRQVVTPDKWNTGGSQPGEREHDSIRQSHSQ